VDNVWLILVIVAVVAYLIYRGYRRSMTEAGQKQEQVEGKYLSQVGDRSSGILACPVCGGMSFKAKRSAGAKVGLGLTLGLGALLAPKTRVRCETCGTEYLRG